MRRSRTSEQETYDKVLRFLEAYKILEEKIKEIGKDGKED